MAFFLELWIFVFGLFIGSFLNCVIYRLEIGKNLKGRSFCPFCKQNLNWRDLAPVFSFVFLKGRCRYCGKQISWQYPIVEITTALLFLLITNYQLPITNGLPTLDLQTLISALFLFVVASFLIVIFVYDLKHYIIPDKILFSAIGIVFLYKLFGAFEFRIFDLFNPITAAITTSAFFLAIFLLTRGNGLGFGDVKLAFFMGFFLGYPDILTAVFISFWLGAIIGLGLVLFKIKKMKSQMPFGPFLVAGTFIALFWGQSILNWYLNFLR